MQTSIGLVHYGSPAFLPLLNEWVRIYKDSKCRLPVVILADLTVPIPSEFIKRVRGKPQQFSYVRFDPMDNIRIMRPGKAFDAKGAIIIQAIQHILDPLLIVDTDAFFVKDPTALIQKLPDERLMMGDDPNTRYIQGVLDGNNAVAERNAGVLYFCGDDDYGRTSLAAQYVHTFVTLRELNNNAMLEQCTWTMLSRKYSQTKLPRPLNWSYIWDRYATEAFIVHEHGPQKWEKINGASRTMVGTLDPIYKNAYK